MAGDIPFNRTLDFEYRAVTELSPMIRRVVAENPSAFTLYGTGTYIVGRGQVAIIDPGPALDDHVDAVLQAVAGEQVTHLLVTHTHIDHSPAARAVQQRTGAPTYGFGPHGGGRDGPQVEEGGDYGFVPDVVVGDGDVIAGASWTVEAVHTPGHTSNHLCFALREEDVLFSGDHVMGRRAATRFRGSLPPPTESAPRSTAIPSPMSSTAISTTPTSAISAASSAPSPRAS